jgi:hypothetical protein
MAQAVQPQHAVAFKAKTKRSCDPACPACAAQGPVPFSKCEPRRFRWAKLTPKFPSLKADTIKIKATCEIQRETWTFGRSGQWTASLRYWRSAPCLLPESRVPRRQRRHQARLTMSCFGEAPHRLHTTQRPRVRHLRHRGQLRSPIVPTFPRRPWRARKLTFSGLLPRICSTCPAPPTRERRIRHRAAHAPCPASQPTVQPALQAKHIPFHQHLSGTSSVVPASPPAVRHERRTAA